MGIDNEVQANDVQQTDEEAGAEARDTAKPNSIIIDIPDKAALDGLHPAIKAEADERTLEGERLYRVEFQVHFHTFRQKDGDFTERQLKVIWKWRKYEMVGEFTFQADDEAVEVKEEGRKPTYGVTHCGLYIHLRDGLLPNEEGYLRGRFEVNRRVATVYQVVDLSPVALPDGTEKAVDKLTDDEFRELASTGALSLTERFGLADENDFLSVNIFPIEPDDPLFGRMAVVVIKKASRRDEEEYAKMVEKIEKAVSVARKHGSFRSFGPDRNYSFVHIYPPEGHAYK